MKNTTTVNDPVCRMAIEPTAAVGRSEFEGETYSFCGSNCKEKFDRDPEQYLGGSFGTPKAVRGLWR